MAAGARSVLVTGAADGIGLGIATRFAQAGDRVALLDYDESRLGVAVEGLLASGVRSVYAYSPRATGSTPHPSYAFPDDITRLRDTYFASDDQLATLAMGTPVDEANWRLARDLGLPIYAHVNDAAAGLQVELNLADLIGLRREPLLQELGVGPRLPHQVARRVEGTFENQIKLAGHHHSPLSCSSMRKFSRRSAWASSRRAASRRLS